MNGCWNWDVSTLINLIDTAESLHWSFSIVDEYIGFSESFLQVCLRPVINIDENDFFFPVIWWRKSSFLDLIICVLTSFFDIHSAPLHGFAFWFDVEFNGRVISSTKEHSSFIESSSNQSADYNNNQRRKRSNPNDALVLSTAPEEPPTHWQQVIQKLVSPILLKYRLLILPQIIQPYSGVQ